MCDIMDSWGYENADERLKGQAMKILMVSPGRLPVPAIRGGAVETLIDELLCYNETYTRHEITVLAVYDRQAAERAKAFRYSKWMFVRTGKLLQELTDRHWIPYRWLAVLFCLKAIKKLKKEQFDCIVIQNELASGRFLKKLIPGRYIYHSHNDTLKASAVKDAAFLRECEKVIMISGFLENQWRKKAGLTNMQKVSNGIDLSVFDREKCLAAGRKLRKQYGIGDQEIVVVFAGRLVPDKGIGELLQAMRLLRGKNVRLMVLGASLFEGSSENAYVRRLRKLSEPCRDRIIFTGYIPHDRMPEYYAMADIGCVPSVWEEPFGLTAVEQMAMGLPMVATDSGALPEIIDESCGYLVTRDSKLSRRLAGCIRALAEDAEKRSRMGKNAEAIARSRFSREAFCRKWFACIDGGIESEKVL